MVAAKVMESAEAIYRDRVLYKGEEARLQNWRVSYYYKAACFHAGRCTAREVVEELLDIIHHTDIQDYSDTGINKNLTAVSYLVAYEVKMPPADRREMACRTEEVMDRSLRYLNNVPQNQYSRVVSPPQPAELYSRGPQADLCPLHDGGRTDPHVRQADAQKVARAVRGRHGLQDGGGSPPQPH